MAPCRLKQFFPDAKFIVLLRDPAYRLFSALNMGRESCLARVGMQSSSWPNCCGQFNEFKPEMDQAFNVANANYEKCLSTFVDGIFLLP